MSTSFSETFWEIHFGKCLRQPAMSGSDIMSGVSLYVSVCATVVKQDRMNQNDTLKKR